MPSDDLTMGESTTVELKGPDGQLKVRRQARFQPFLRPRAERVMSVEERADRPRIRPLRNEYQHARCQKTTKLGQGIAETLAINPTYYATTYCFCCTAYFPVSEFMWNDGPQVGI